MNCVCPEQQVWVWFCKPRSKALGTKITQERNSEITLAIQRLVYIQFSQYFMFSLVSVYCKVYLQHYKLCLSTFQSHMIKLSSKKNPKKTKQKQTKIALKLSYLCFNMALQQSQSWEFRATKREKKICSSMVRDRNIIFPARYSQILFRQTNHLQ